MAPGSDLTAFRDVSCPVDVILGTGRMSVRECVALVPRTVIRLLETAGDDVQLRVGSVALARGEVIVDDERAVIRVTELLPTGPGEATD